MIDAIREEAAETLKLTSAEVAKARAALLDEVATEDVRYAASSALLHPEGSTTPIEEAYSRAQDRVARIRERVEKEMPSMMKLLMSLEIAEQRRDEARVHREQKLQAQDLKSETGVDKFVRDFFRRLAKHGVSPSQLREHKNETVAIIADLMIWKAKDATFKKPENPWRDVLAVYATRKIDMPTKHGRKGGSVPGAPRPDRHNTGSGDYRFDEMIGASWDVTIRDIGSIAVEPEPVITMPTIDCSIYPEPAPEERPSSDDALFIDEAEAKGVVIAADTSPALIEQAQPAHGTTPNDQVEHGRLPEISATELADSMVLPEYALPASITAVQALALRNDVTARLKGEYFDSSDRELRRALGRPIDELSDEDAIANAEAVATPIGCTPYRYFSAAARLHGRETGLVEYREATIQRIMFSFATEPAFVKIRTRLGLGT